MTQYAKFISKTQIQYAPANYELEDGTIIFNFNLNPTVMLQYKYKKLIEAEKPSGRVSYSIIYKEYDASIKEVIKLHPEEDIQRREREFEAEFFNTSLGYIRRSVNMATGTRKDFLSDLLPAIKTGLEAQMEVKIIAYDKPSFEEEIIDWTPYQHVVVATQQFVLECSKQLSDDFLPINPE